MSQIFIVASSLLGFIGVALGAFGAHALKQKLSPEMLAIFETGARYHLIHAAVLLGIGILARQMDVTALKISGFAMIFGIIVFSGSLYALAISGVRVLGAITPIGGLGLLVGWGALALSALQNP
jgi:uncharacterized membrane protein YgdD (TMEM256/DUF423 family)